MENLRCENRPGIFGRVVALDGIELDSGAPAVLAANDIDQACGKIQ